MALLTKNVPIFDMVAAGYWRLCSLLRFCSELKTALACFEIFHYFVKTWTFAYNELSFLIFSFSPVCQRCGLNANNPNQVGLPVT